MAPVATLGVLIKAVRRRLWLARAIRLIEIGLRVGVGLFAVCAVLHRFVYALPPLYCIALALLPLGLMSALALVLRPPQLDYAARIADHWVDAKCLLLSAWELLDRSSKVETIAKRYVLTQAAQAIPLWRNQLSQRPLLRLPNHAVSLVAVGLTTGFLLLAPGAEPEAARPQLPQAASAAIAAADRSSVDAAVRLEQQLLASLKVPRAGSRAEKGVRHPQPPERSGANTSAADNDYTTSSAETGHPVIANDPMGASEAALAGERSHRNATPRVAGPGAGAAGDLPGIQVASGADDRSPPDASSLALRYVELERARLEDNAASTLRTGVELDRRVSGPGKKLPPAGIAPPAQYTQTPLAVTLSPEMGRYAADYFSALRNEG